MGACAAEREGGAAELASGAIAQYQATSDVVTPEGGASSDAGVDADPPSYTASVTAEGDGCPAGAWAAEVSPDQGNIKVRFDAYDVEVGEAEPAQRKSCRLVIKLKSQGGASFAVTDFAHEGYAQLDEGVEGKQSSSYYFNLFRVTARLRNTFLSGPRDGDHRSEPIGEGDVFWTPCVTESDLIIHTHLELRNGGTSAHGYASAEPGLSLDVHARRCTLPTPAPARPPADAGSPR